MLRLPTEKSLGQHSGDVLGKENKTVIRRHHSSCRSDDRCTGIKQWKFPVQLYLVAILGVVIVGLGTLIILL